MTIDDWKPIAERINRLWQPPMDGRIAEEFFAVLEEFPAWAVDKAVTLAAKMPRQYRPDVGTLYQAAESLERARRAEEPVPEADPVSPAEHRLVLEEEQRRQTAEHRRRHETVVALLRSTGYRAPLGELPDLMATSQASAEEFDQRMAGHRERAPRRLVADL